VTRREATSWTGNSGIAVDVVVVVELVGVEEGVVDVVVVWETNKTYTLPAPEYPPAVSPGAPTTTVLSLTATDQPKYPIDCALGLVT